MNKNKTLQLYLITIIAIMYYEYVFFCSFRFVRQIETDATCGEFVCVCVLVRAVIFKQHMFRVFLVCFVCVCFVQIRSSRKCIEKMYCKYLRGAKLVTFSLFLYVYSPLFSSVQFEFVALSSIVYFLVGFL